MRRIVPPSRRIRTIALRPSVEVMERRQLLATLMVTNALDSGAGSFRQALLDADAAQVASTIDFSISGAGVHTIALASSLPEITAPITLDGTTQPGYAGSPLVSIDGSGASNGTGLTFRYGATGSTVLGLAFVRFLEDAIVTEGPQVTIQADEFGVDPAGGPSAGDGVGVAIFGGNNSPSGGPAPGSVVSGNIFSGNGDGVDLFSAYNNVISGNVITGNSAGVNLYSAFGTVISGNFIGTDATGRTDLGNANDGVFISSGSSPTTVSNNVIANNGKLGIDDQSSPGAVLSGNTLTNNGYRIANINIAASSTTVATSTGKTVTLTYTLTNQGPNTATNVSFHLGSRTSAGSFDFTFTPSPVFKLLSTSASQGMIVPGATLNNYSFSPFALIGTLAPGASATVTVAVLIIGSGTDSLDASARSDQPTTIPTGTSASTSFVASGTADLAVAALPPPAARVGAPETFTFVVTNRDPLFSADAKVVLDFGLDSAPDLTGVLVSQGTVSKFTQIPSPNVYTGDLGLLAPGASAVVTAVIIPTQGGRVGASLSVYSASDVDPNPSNNLAVAGAIVSNSPTVLGAVLQPASGAVTSVLVDFSSSLTRSKAQDLRNYRLTTNGGKARIAVRSATYDDATRSVTLKLSGPLLRPGSPVTLVVGGPGTPGITAPDGSKLVGGVATLTINRF